MSDIPAGPRPVPKGGVPWWGWTLIASGVIVVLAIPVLFILGLVAYVGHSLGETSPDQAFLTGPAQQPDAVTPLPCPEQCFELDAANLIAVSPADLTALAITDELYGVGAFESTTVADAAAQAGEQWLALGGDEECAFLPSNAPYIVLGPDSASQDPIGWVQTWETDYEIADIAARAFPTTEAASAFMRDVHGRVTACPWQDLKTPSAGGLDTTLVQITAPAAIDVPEDVAAIGWVREGAPGPRWRSYVWDLQRGNLIVQVRVLTDGRVLEHDVAAFAELMAERLGGIPLEKS